MKTLSVWIPGAPLGPNQRIKLNTRLRMSYVRQEREKAKFCAISSRFRAESANGRRVLVFNGLARILMELRRHRELDEVNAIASLKHYQDGLCLAVLPKGDGPTRKTGYSWKYIQIKIAQDDVEGCMVYIEEPEPGDAPVRPFSGNPT